MVKNELWFDHYEQYIQVILRSDWHLLLRPYVSPRSLLFEAEENAMIRLLILPVIWVKTKLSIVIQVSAIFLNLSHILFRLSCILYW